MSARVRNRRPVAIAVPDRIVPVLGLISLMLVALYIVLVLTTIFFAAWQTQLARTIEDTRMSIHTLETQYYEAIAKIDATDPSSVGLVAPKKIEYVVASRMPGLTFAR